MVSAALPPSREGIREIHARGEPRVLRRWTSKLISPSDAERELFCIDPAGRTQCGNGYAQEADALCHRKLRPQQLQGNLLQCHAPFDHAAHRLAARDLLEVRIFDFQRHSATACSSTLAMTPDFIDDWQERVPRCLEGEEISGKRVL